MESLDDNAATNTLGIKIFKRNTMSIHAVNQSISPNFYLALAFFTDECLNIAQRCHVKYVSSSCRRAMNRKG